MRRASCSRPYLKIEKLTKKIGQVEKQVVDLEKKMAMAGYETKVPASVQVENTEKLAKLHQEIESTRSAIGRD